MHNCGRYVRIYGGSLCNSVLRATKNNWQHDDDDDDDASKLEWWREEQIRWDTGGFISTNRVHCDEIVSICSLKTWIGVSKSPRKIWTFAPRNLENRWLLLYRLGIDQWQSVIWQAIIAVMKLFALMEFVIFAYDVCNSNCEKCL